MGLLRINSLPTSCIPSNEICALSIGAEFRLGLEISLDYLPAIIVLASGCNHAFIISIKLASGSGSFVEFGDINASASALVK